MILLLEDNSDRLRRFTDALRAIEPALELRSWRSAWRMIRTHCRSSAIRIMYRS